MRRNKSALEMNWSVEGIPDEVARRPLTCDSVAASRGSESSRASAEHTMALGPRSHSFLYNQLPPAEILEQLQNVRLENLVRDVIFSGQSRNHLRDTTIPVAELPDLATNFVQRVVVAIFHVQED